MTNHHDKASTAAERLIAKLGLGPHPEGGYYREVYRAKECIPQEALPGRYSGPRSVCTGIYYLLKGNDFSAFHRVASDEQWHFHEGCPVIIHSIDAAARRLRTVRLGLTDEATPHHVVPAGTWFAAELESKAAHALVGCTVAPGFDFADFELATRAQLAQAFPELATVIARLTRQ